MTTNNRCTSCNTEIANDSGAVGFKCPKCQKTDVVRCTKCRKLTTKYKCRECGHIGPN